MKLECRPMKLVGMAVLMAASFVVSTAQSHPDLISSTKTITTQDQVEEWLTYYYLHPRPDLTIPALQYVDQEGWLKKDNARPPIVGFFAQVLAQNPDRTKEWAAELATASEAQRSVFATALWMVNSDDSRGLLAHMASNAASPFRDHAENLLKKPPPNLLKDEVDSPSFLDALWGSFFATGDERYVQRLISVLPYLKKEGDIQKLLIGGAAKWSLTANAVQHAKVLEICQSELGKLPDGQRAALTEIINKAKEPKH